jgi:lycopene beta-cyclase
MPEPHYDLAILGGGCAGLSLAYRLAGSGLRIAVLEPREIYEPDRTWSFWRTRPDPFEECVVKRWSRWRVSGPGGGVVRSSDAMRYETVCAGRFYDTCLARIDACGDIDLRLATRVEALSEGRPVTVRTDRGALRADRVVDTRPVGGRPAYGQFFAGAEIRTDAPVFDDETVELMDFGRPRRDRIDFAYVLPFAPDRALVEATTFGAAPPAAGDLDAALSRLVAERTGQAGHEVLRRERGTIPMDAGHVAPARPGVVPLGLRGGASRPSTGYSFVRIQEMADRAAAALREGRAPDPPRLDGPVTRRMDALFLKVLRRHPERGPELFTRLFAEAPPQRLERFLSGSTAWRDRMSVVLSLPPALFLRTLASP